jgi:nicotinate phosphoribosyltransferase
MDIVLDILRNCAGYYDDRGAFINTYSDLEVRMVPEGTVIPYSGPSSEARPVAILTGRFRDFALLKTPVFGILSRASRSATNIYRMLQAANGKPVYTFCARYDPPQVQEIDGYAYHVAVARYNSDYGLNLPDKVSTVANAELWGGETEGTISHEAIACFCGDAARLMLHFAESLPEDRIRVALVDFHNDCVTDTRRVMAAMFERYRYFADASDHARANRYKLHGVRLDTSADLIDSSLAGVASDGDYGVSPRLVRIVREVIDTEWQRWDIPAIWHERARHWCKQVKIVVSGGFSESRIREFESAGVPVDCYGVGSALLNNTGDALTDFASVVMRTAVGGTWYDVAKHGRRRNWTEQLRVVR